MIGRKDPATALPPGDPAQETRPVRSRRIWTRLALAVATIAAAVTWQFPRWEQAPVPAVRTEAMLPSVQVADAVTGDIPVTLEGLGTVTPIATITVRTQINGLLTAVGFKEGQSVKKGDFLAQIDPRPYQALTQQAQGQLAHDEALLAGAQIDLTRYQELIRQNSIAKQLVDTQTYLVRQYQGTVQVDQALLDNAKLNLMYCRIESPVDGRAGLRLVDEGNYLQTTSAGGIVVVTQMQPTTVIFILPEDRLPSVNARLRAGAALPVAAYDRGNAALIANGTLQSVDNQIDPTTGTVKLRAIFANTDEALFPNQFVNARLLVDTLHDATIVPAGAVQTGALGNYLYVVAADRTVSARPVTLGPRDGDRVAVLTGIAPGAKVVVDGADRLHDGAKVAIPDGAPPLAGPDTKPRKPRH